MPDQTPSKKKAARKKAARKAAPAKKASAKKVVPTRKSSAKKAAPGRKKSASVVERRRSSIDPKLVNTIQSMVQEMNQERDIRDKQIASLINEVQQGFSTITHSSSKQGNEHEKEMTGLYQTLHNAFGTIRKSNEENEDRNLHILKQLTESIRKEHEQNLKETQELEKLQDKKLKHLAKVQEQRTGRNRLIAIPGVVIAVTAIVYMFYIVNIMESAMTSMSNDMNKIQASVGNMSGNMGTISQATTSMNSNLQQLNGNTQRMSTDLNVMTHNVAPAMNGMRAMMPWVQ